jgi:hypothetical protein
VLEPVIASSPPRRSVPDTTKNCAMLPKRELIKPSLAVTYVEVESPARTILALRLVVDARPEIKRFVVVALVVVALEPVKFWRVVEPRARKLVE